MDVLHVRDFAQIEDARIEFGDLTVLVGPQATGKSLLLQWLKVAVDLPELVAALREAGHDVRQQSELVDLVFGEGMSKAWRAGSTSVEFKGQPVALRARSRKRAAGREGALFYVPAHRALLLAEGWPAPFLKLNADTPVVARLFSQNLYERFSGRQKTALFPVSRLLKNQYRVLIDDAVFHGARVDLDKEGLKYRLRLKFADGADLPFMTWTAGQREFTPLLLGLYHVLLARKAKKRKGVDWVVVEEPEMGLHPRAIAVFMLLVLDLMWRGYKVVLSTHSPLVLDIVWAIQEIAGTRNGAQLLCDAFGVASSGSVRGVMSRALECRYKVYFMELDSRDGKVRARDISRLDPTSEIVGEADWGGLTDFSSRFGDAVRRAANRR